MLEPRAVDVIDRDLEQCRRELIVAEDTDREAIGDVIRWEIRQLLNERDLALNPDQRMLDGF